MSIQVVRNSILGLVAAVAILFGGLWAGRLAAGPLGRGRGFSAERTFSRIADRLDLTDSQRDQVRGVLKARKDAILGNIRAVRGARLAVRHATEADPRLRTMVKTAEILLIIAVSFLLSPPAGMTLEQLIAGQLFGCNLSSW